MKHITPTYLRKGMQAIDQTYEDSVTHLAGHITPILKDFCDRYGFKYISGNGTYLIVRLSDNKIMLTPEADLKSGVPEFDHSSKTWEAYVHLCGLLETTVDRDHGFFDYVGDYTPEKK